MFFKSNSLRGKQNESRQTSLQCEALENRLMLSTVEIFAAGETGQEAFNLLVDGNVVQTFENVGGNFEARDFEIFTFTTEETLTADQIEIEFINDDFDPETGLDNNLFVDGFILDGAEFESEAPTTFSTGFIGEDGEFTGPGFFETEILNVNGSFSFLADNDGGNVGSGVSSTVEIFAAGETGQEAFNLLVDGNVVQTFENVGGNFEARDFEIFTFTSEETLTADQIEIEFINDDFDPGTGRDNNLFVDGFILDGAEFETEAPTTFSTGFIGDEGFTGPGFLETEVLNVNGRFSFLAGNDGGNNVLSSGTRIRVDATGQTGEEILQLEIDGQLVTEFQLDQAGQEQVLLFTTDRIVDASQLTIRFSNDLFDEATGFDRNVFVSAFQTIDLETGNRDILSTIDTRVFTDASFTEADGILSGFGRGGNLVTDSFLQVRDSVTRIRVDALGQTGQELFEVVANGEVIGTFQASTQEQIFLVETPEFINLADVQVRFINDSFDPATGADNNLEIVRFQAIDLASGSRAIALPTDGTVFGEGVFEEGVGVGSGFGLGNTLVVNGFFQFQPDEV